MPRSVEVPGFLYCEPLQSFLISQRMLTRAYIGWKANLAVISVTLLITRVNSADLAGVSKCPLSPSSLHMQPSQSHTLGQKGWPFLMTVLHKWAATTVPWYNLQTNSQKLTRYSSTPPKTTLIQLLLFIRSWFYKTESRVAHTDHFPLSSPALGLSVWTIIPVLLFSLFLFFGFCLFCF